MGVLACSRDGCGGIARPQTKVRRLKQQLLDERCTLDTCGGVYEHIACSARSEIHTDDSTMIFKHLGEHEHDPPPKIHINLAAAKQFADAVAANPLSSPIRLVTGSSLGPGPGQSVAILDESLNNAGRVAYYRSAVLANGNVPRAGGDKFIDSLHAFAADNPDFVSSIQLVPLVLITLQSPYMASEMSKEIIANEGNHGFVTDANHGFWSDDRKYLFMTTTYSTRLHGWVPILFAYSGGQSEAHYREYFLQLFLTMRRHVGTEVELKDECYAQVCSHNLLAMHVQC